LQKDGIIISLMCDKFKGKEVLEHFIDELIKSGVEHVPIWTPPGSISDPNIYELFKEGKENLVNSSESAAKVANGTTALEGSIPLVSDNKVTDRFIFQSHTFLPINQCMHILGYRLRRRRPQAAAASAHRPPQTQRWPTI
jgi:hypothetical protein